MKSFRIFWPWRQSGLKIFAEPLTTFRKNTGWIKKTDFFLESILFKNCLINIIIKNSLKNRFKKERDDKKERKENRK